MIVTHEDSMRIYRELANSVQAPDVPLKPREIDPYRIDGRDQVALVRTNGRSEGIVEAFKLLGGLSSMTKGVDGEIIIKPNCNTDDVFPRDSHPDTVRFIAEALIETGVKPRQIVVGDMSGRARGLPTRATIENLGIKAVAEEMGLGLSYFDEEPWVKLKPLKAVNWTDGIIIPKRIYNADRVIFTPILRSHTTAIFTCALKLGVGLLDAASRDILHDGEAHHEKVVQMNMAWDVNMVLSDAMQMNTGHGTDPIDQVEPGIIIASNNLVANDAVAVALMRYYNTVKLNELPTRKHKQLELATQYGLGSSGLHGIEFKYADLVDDPGFDELLAWIKGELED
jgi:uncharacterized protein (DUF362 family)